MNDNLILEWTRDLNIHDSIPVPDLVKQRPVSSPYLLSIQSLEGGQIDLDSLVFTMTFFHSRSTSFFGRTFTFGRELCTFYHSKIVDEEAMGICEIIQINRANASERKLLGWCRLFCFGEKPGENSPIFAGSSRVLLHKEVHAQIPGVSLKYSVRLFEGLQAAFSLLPENVCCGPHEAVPGVRNRKIALNEQVAMERSASLSINNIVVNPGIEIEQKVLGFVEKYQKEKLGNTDNRRAKIEERRVLVGTHNTWTYIGNNGPDSTAVLRLDGSSLIAPGIVSIKNTVDDPMIAVIFELQYIVLVPKKTGESDEIISINIAWAPHVGDKEGSFAISMIPGPGRSISGKMLWDNSIEVEIQFDMSLQGFSQSRVYERSIVEMPSDRGLIRENDNKNSLEVKRMQDEMRRLQEELEREKRRDKEPQRMIPIPAPVKMQESSIQTMEFEKPIEQPERLNATYMNPPDYSHLDAIVPSSNTAPQGFGTVSLESYPKNISRSDKARLVKSGIRGLLDYDQSFSNYSPRLDVEAQDPLKAATFVIQFLAYRQTNRNKKLPENVCFGMRFYHFANLITESVFIRPGDPGMPWLIEKSGPSPEMLVKYEVEACVWDHIDFAKYLLKKSLTIEVWDSQSHMIIGFVRIQLIDLLRQGKPSVVITKEFAILSDFNGEQIGSLQILMRNAGTQSAIRMQPSQNPLKISGGQARHKNRARAKPLEVTQNEPPIAIGNDENRKKIRVMEYKKSMRKPEDETWELEKEMNHIGMVRENRKPMVIKQALREYLSNAQKLFVRPGQALTFQFSLHNPHGHEECFTLALNDADLSIIKSPIEWQWWVTHLNYDKPLDYDSLTEDNSVVLRPGETIPLIFKYFSWDPQSKVISSWIHQSKGSPLCALELEIVPESAPVDHVLHYYEYQGRISKIRLPPLFVSEAQFKPIIQCSLSTTVINWETENEISLDYKVPIAPNTTSFNIVVYDNIYCSEMKANWEVKVHSLIGNDVSVTMGQSTSVRISCPGDEARTVTLFSSSPEVIFFPPPHNKPFTLMPRTDNNLPVVIRSDTPVVQQVRIHCVDVFHKKLIHAWIFKIQTTGTNVTQTFDLKCPMNSITEKRVMFTNRSQSWAVFHFRSSNPKVLEIKEPRLPLEGGAKGFLPVLITPPQVPSFAEVSVFANDSEENIFECMLFKIDFSA